MEEALIEKPVPDVVGLANFEIASKAVIEYLHNHVGVGMWMTTRVADSHQVLLAGEAKIYGLEPGVALPWADTICHRMTNNSGPNIALNLAEVPEYAESPLLQYAEVGSYVGVPINTGGGELFGTLCALDPQPQQKNIDAKLPLLKLLAQLLGAVATLEIDGIQHSRHIEALKIAAFTDKLTGLANRAGWEQHLDHVRTALAQLGSPLCILIVDLDGLKQVNDNHGHADGDALLKTAANLLSDNVRVGDIVARIGGDEFAVAALECTKAMADELEQRIIDALQQANIPASVGLAWHRPHQTLSDTIDAADKAMYAVKRQRQG